jgi:hypothetical protein
MSVVQRDVQPRATIAEKIVALAGLSVLVRVEKRGDFGLKTADFVNEGIPVHAFVGHHS